MNSIITLHFDIQNNLKLLYLKNNIKSKLNQIEEPKENALLEKKLKEESKEKISSFKKDTNTSIIMIKIYLRNQRSSFIKRARNKLFKKFIKNNLVIKEDGIIETRQKSNINITPIKNINNDILSNQIMLRTKGDISYMSNYFFPTQIFFDEDKNFLFRNNINVLEKKEKYNIEEITRNFINRYYLSYNVIIQEYIKKINEIFDSNYRDKIKKYKMYYEITSFYEMIIKDECYKNDLIKNEIELHKENIKYLNELEDLQIEKNDKLIEIIDRFKINSPIDNRMTNEIVNDYIYEILEVFM